MTTKKQSIPSYGYYLIVGFLILILSTVVSLKVDSNYDKKLKRETIAKQEATTRQNILQQEADRKEAVRIEEQKEAARVKAQQESAKIEAQQRQEAAEKEYIESEKRRRQYLITRKEEIRKNLIMGGFVWGKVGFGIGYEAEFEIQNRSTYDVKDIVIGTVQIAKSGTILSRDTNTIYRIVDKRDTTKIRRINLGLIHSQTDDVRAGILDFTVIER